MQSGSRPDVVSGKPPTRKKVEVICAVFVRVNPNGLIYEQREYCDIATFLKQLQYPYFFCIMAFMLRLITSMVFCSLSLGLNSQTSDPTVAIPISPGGKILCFSC